MIALFAAPLVVQRAIGAAPTLGGGAGQIFQGFDAPNGEDGSAFRRDERAIWGRGSALTASTHFPGTGGPGGDFDWTVAAGETFVLDTNFATITSADGSRTQNVVGGVVHVRDLVVQSSGALLVRGPNACRIVATGDVWIAGRVLARGIDHPGVSTIGTGIPSLGAAGGPGGGRGGTSSLLVTQSTPQGEAGYGAWDTPLGGGGGGEAGYNSSASVDARRGSGGGGGRFGGNALLPNGCPAQHRVGLDVEQGGPGSAQASGAIGGPGQRPVPGAPGGGPFADGDPTNDFFGRMVTSTGAVIVGELPRPWAGAGGGAGGDAINAATFPTPGWNPASDEVGGGGGGGGGSLLLQVLGDLTLVGVGRIDVSGGTGGGGENTSGMNRVGAAGGGGSGGHLIVQVGGVIDLEACAAPTPLAINPGALVALGGQGGAGRNGVGGSGPNGVPTTPALDSINLVAPYDPSCLVPPPQHAAVDGSGGDGGPGLVQLHVADLADVRTPIAAGVTLASVVLPAPIGAVDPDVPSTWNRLVPPFGPHSSSRSQWIALPAPSPAYFTFDGTDANGYVATTGAGSAAVVAPGSSIASSHVMGTGLPRIAVDGRALLLDPAAFVQDVWTEEADSLVGGSLEFTTASGVRRFDIAATSTTDGVTRLEVAAPGTPLAAVPIGTLFDVRPRCFRVSTDAVAHALPTSASIRVTFQGAPAGGPTGPDLAFAGPWTADAASLAAIPGVAYVRYQVDFDVTADGSELSTSSPRPSLEYLRLFYRY